MQHAIKSTEHKAGVLEWLSAPVVGLLIAAFGLSIEAVPAWLSIAVAWSVSLLIMFRATAWSAWKVYEESGRLAPDDEAKALLRKLRGRHVGPPLVGADGSSLTTAQALRLFGEAFQAAGKEERLYVRLNDALPSGTTLSPNAYYRLVDEFVWQGLVDHQPAASRAEVVRFPIPSTGGSVGPHDRLELSPLGHRVYVELMNSPDEIAPTRPR